MQVQEHNGPEPFRLTARACAAAAAGIAALALAGWLAGAPALAGIRAGYIPMAPNTALSFIILGACLWGITVRRWPGRRWAGGAAVFVALLAALRAGEYVCGADWGVDRWFFSFPGGRLGPAQAGRMALPTALTFLPAGAALLLLSFPARPGHTDALAGGLAVIVAFIGLVFTLGYRYGAPLLYGAGNVPMAINTAAGFLLLGIGSIAASAGRARLARGLEEEALREREVMYRTLYETSHDAHMTLFPPDWRFAAGNPAAVALFGAKDEADFTSMRLWEVSPEYQPDGELSSVKAGRLIGTAMERGGNLFEWTYKKIGGPDFPAAVLLTRFELGGKAGLQATVRDITGRKQMESRQELAAAVFRCLACAGGSREVIRDILLAVKRYTGIEAAGVRLKAGEDYPYYWTEGFPEEFVGKEDSPCARQGSGPQDRDASGNVLFECMCGIVVSGRTDSVRPSFTKGGSFWTNCTTDLLAAAAPEQRRAEARNRCNKAGYESVALIPLRSKNRIIGLLQLNDKRKGRFTLDLIEFLEGLGVSIGIAVERATALEEMHKLEEQFRQAQKMESVGRLAGGVAHDFNNLLTAITAYAGFVLEKLDGGDPRREDVMEILAAAGRAGKLTRQLLAFSRRQMLNPQVIDLNSIVGGTVNMLQRLIGEDIKIETRLAAKPCLARVDDGQFGQVLINLAVNARDAMRNGGTLTLETGLLTAGERASLWPAELPGGDIVGVTVRDTGCGMDAETKAHIFEPFFTTKEKGRGTGLGLATAFGIIKQSGGELRFESEPGCGTTFRIYFPRAEAGPPDKDKNEDKKGAVRGSETILLVEDEESLRRLGERLLGANGYTVISAADGAGALAAAANCGKPVDLLITDVVMPGMSGRELARELSRRKLVGRTLYMSGYTDDAIVKHGVLEPGLAFIYKPFTVEAFSGKVREVLDAPAGRAEA